MPNKLHFARYNERCTIFPQHTQKMNFTDGRLIANRLSWQNSLVANLNAATVSPSLTAACLQLCVFRLLWEHVRGQGGAAVISFS